jgi:hypothetical protein
MRIRDEHSHAIPAKQLRCDLGRDVRCSAEPNVKHALK